MLERGVEGSSSEDDIVTLRCELGVYGAMVCQGVQEGVEEGAILDLRELVQNDVLRHPNLISREDLLGILKWYLVPWRLLHVISRLLIHLRH
jgi:hypothetical protein